MNVLEKVQSVKLIRPEEGDIIVVLVKEHTKRDDLEGIHDIFYDALNELHPGKKIQLVAANNIEDIKIIR